MNRVYKIVWSKAKNAYVVTSELAKNHTRSASGKAVKAALTVAVGMGVLMGGYAADAAAKDIVDKGGNLIAYDISPANEGTNIAVGKNAKVFIGGGTQESMLSFGETIEHTLTGMHIHSNNAAKQNLPAGMAVGTNTYARTGSIQMGDHTLEKNQIAIGDTTADKLRQFGVASTTLGTNSYTGGGFATTIGSYNVQSSQYEAKDFWDTLDNSTKNAFSTVVGTLNSNESMTGSSSSGVTNVINGTANKVTNSNGAIVMGAGNSIKNSSASINTSAYSTNYASVAAMQKALMDGVARSAGGSTLAIGGANAAEYTQASQLIGVGNTLTGKSGNVSKYNMLDGYKNKASNVQHVSVIGSENNVTNTNGAVVFGDKRTLTGADGSIVIGSSANGTATSVKNAIAIGSETNVTVAGGVALGSSSVASVDKGAVGYDASGTNHNSDTTGVWKSTAAAVSVGDAAGNTKVTRQITNVAAGKEDTDAVNVAQLKAVKAAADAAKVHFFSVKGNSSDENYNNDGATGDRALAVGVAAKAGGLKATALTGGNASGDFSFAVGNNAQAKGWGSVAIGAGTLAENQGTVAIGHGAKAYSLESVALGYNTQAGAPSGQPGAGNHAQTAMGSGTIATGGAATAFGFESVASGAHAIAGGDKAKATGQDSVALGKDTKASGTWSVALGSDTKAEGQSSTALGTDTTASGIASTAMGSKTQATGVGSTAMGGSTTAAGNWSLASGGLSEAKGDYSTAMGYNSKANARNSFAVSGGIVEAAAKNSIAMGEGAKASVSDAVALGSGSVASTEKGKIGYDISGADHSNDTTGVWKSTANAISVGDVANHVTRQITGVAAGAADTDAVNVAQLKKVEAKAEAAEKKYTEQHS